MESTRPRQSFALIFWLRGAAKWPAMTLSRQARKTSSANSASSARSHFQTRSRRKAMAGHLL